MPTRLPGKTQAQLPEWFYIGGETITANGDVAATVPASAQIVEIRARGGAVYYAINTAICGTTSPGYIPEDQAEIVGPLSNLTTLRVYGGAATVYAHVMYFREA